MSGNSPRSSDSVVNKRKKNNLYDIKSWVFRVSGLFGLVIDKKCPSWTWAKWQKGWVTEQRMAMYKCQKPSKSCRLVNPILHKPVLQDARFVLVRIFNVLHIYGLNKYMYAWLLIEQVSAHDQMRERFASSVWNFWHWIADVLLAKRHSAWEQRSMAVFAGVIIKLVCCNPKYRFTIETIVNTVAILCFMWGWKLASLVTSTSRLPAR